MYIISFMHIYYTIYYLLHVYHLITNSIYHSNTNFIYFTKHAKI